MATGTVRSESSVLKLGSDPVTDESSDSDGEAEPSKSFHRRISTSKAIKAGVCIKEGFLMKQTSSFQRWRRRYFKIKPRRLYYAKDSKNGEYIVGFAQWKHYMFTLQASLVVATKDSKKRKLNKSLIFEEIDLTDLSIAECSIKNVNHSFQLITPFRRLILCTDSRKEMEEWIGALKSVGNKDFYEGVDHQEVFSGQHNWYVTSHARPTYCNVCREALSGVTSHGVSCEVCKFKAHKRCAAKAPNSCKWTTLASVGNDIIEDEDINITMPHQWMEGNLPVSAKCSYCDKTCGSVLRLQDWRCLWCRAMVHSACKGSHIAECPLGVCRGSIIPPTSLHSIKSDESWDATCPQGCSPLLVFVNSKSGDNQGVKFLRRLKQLLNPAQIFDLMNGGPKPGLRMFRTFNPFRILVCGGDGSVSWVLTEIDKLNMHHQCQVGVLPLGTGNDLARVLGWGSACDDDAQLPQLLEKYERATVKHLDRWCVMTYEGTMPAPRKLTTQFDPISMYEDSVVAHLTKILHSDQHSVVLSSAKVLCETVKDFIEKVGVAYAKETGADEEDSIAHKCEILNQKLGSLLQALDEESLASAELLQKRKSKITSKESPADPPKYDIHGGSLSKSDPEMSTQQIKKSTFIQREALMSRANSLKKAIRKIIEHTERAVDEQNAQTKERQESEICEAVIESELSTETRIDSENVEEMSMAPPLTVQHEDERPTPPQTLPPWNPWGPAMGRSVDASLKDTLQVTLPTIEGGASADSSPCPSPNPYPSPQPTPVSSPTSARPSPEFHSPSHTPGSDVPMSPTHISSPLAQEEGAVGSPGTKKKQGSFSQQHGYYHKLTSGVDETAQSPTATRRISSGATMKQIGNFGISMGSGFGISSLASHEKSSPEATLEEQKFPIINPLASLPMWPNLNKDSLIGKVLLANADALCAAASPLMDVEEMSLEGFGEKCVMNNYFGIGVDAKITLEFHNKREEHPEKCRSRTRNLMWYGVLGGKELLQRTFKNLEQRVQLECDGRRIPLPSLQGIVVLNIPSYGGGSNFWGGTNKDDIFYAPAFDDGILEVVAVFDTVQMAASRVINLHHHRIAQCHSVKIIIMGDEGVPVQVDGEAWMQPPGYICIVHKNQTQVLCRNRQLETASRSWHDKKWSNKIFSEEESHLISVFVEATLNLIRSVKVSAVSHSTVEEILLPLALSSSTVIEKLFPAMRLTDGLNSRQLLNDLVSTVRQLQQEVSLLLHDKNKVSELRPDLETKLACACTQVERELRKCTVCQGNAYFHSEEEVKTLARSSCISLGITLHDQVQSISVNHALKQPVPTTFSSVSQQEPKRRGLFKLKFRKQTTSKGSIKPSESSCQSGEGNRSSTGRGCSGSGCGTPTMETDDGFCRKNPLDSSALSWGTDEVALWLDSIQMGDYKDSFIRHDIQGAELLHLERRDLKELGVTKVGHIKRLLQAIRDIASHSVGRKLASL